MLGHLNRADGVELLAVRDVPVVGDEEVDTAGRRG